jgi:hypothetical protein
VHKHKIFLIFIQTYLTPLNRCDQESELFFKKLFKTLEKKLLSVSLKKSPSLDYFAMKNKGQSNKFTSCGCREREKVGES